jgi:hypothetical protein
LRERKKSARLLHEDHEQSLSALADQKTTRPDETRPDHTTYNSIMDIFFFDTYEKRTPNRPTAYYPREKP